MKATKYIFFAVTMFVSAIFVMAALLMAFDSASAALPLQLPVNIHSLEPIGQIGGSFKALVAQDEYVYAAIGPRLAVLDVSDATHPTLTGQTSILSIDIQALAIQGNVAYAAAGADGLSIFDVSNPSQPVELGSVDMPGFATSVVITGSHAFVTTDIDLQVVDVLQPNTPLIVGSYPGMASDIVFSGNTMFIAVEDKISLIDISDPENLSLVLNYDVPADEIEIAGNVLYVGKLSSVPGPAGAIYYGTLRILDISGLPTITETFFSGDEYPGTVPSQLRDMKLLDHQLYGYGTYCGHATGHALWSLAAWMSAIRSVQPWITPPYMGLRDTIGIGAILQSIISASIWPSKTPCIFLTLSHRWKWDNILRGRQTKCLLRTAWLMSRLARRGCSA